MLRRVSQIRQNPTTLLKRASISHGMSSGGSASRRMKQLAAQLSTEAGVEDPVLFREHFAARIFTLNRPKKYNALTHEMVKLLSAQIEQWDESELCDVIVGTGKGEFCAGGDVKKVVALITNEATRSEAVEFFRDEFMLDYRLSQLRKPYVAIMDGITMGGGVGLSMHAPFRVATERTRFAMPETDIGYFTDVGATHFLSHLDGQLGAYLGLTSSLVTGRQVFECGIATHFVPSRNVPLLLERLSRLEGANHAVINEAIDEFYEHRTADDPPPRLVGPIREAIDKAFESRSPIEIMEKLQALTSGGGEKKKGVHPTVEAWAKETESAIRERSPLSVWVTREALWLAREKSLKGAFETEMRLAQAYCTELAGDFVEGVTAKLVEKPSRQANWKHASLLEVNQGSVQELLNAETALPEGFKLESRTGRAQGGTSYGLPKEEEIETLIKAKAMTEKELIEQVEMAYKGKHGVKAKIEEVVRRKTTSVDSKLVWKRDELVD